MSPVARRGATAIPASRYLFVRGVGAAGDQVTPRLNAVDLAQVNTAVPPLLQLDLNESVAAIRAPGLASGVEVSDRGRVQAGDDVGLQGPEDG
jgi:hypothetical protein